MMSMNDISVIGVPAALRIGAYCVQGAYNAPSDKRLWGVFEGAVLGSLYVCSRIITSWLVGRLIFPYANEYVDLSTKYVDLSTIPIDQLPEVEDSDRDNIPESKYDKNSGFKVNRRRRFEVNRRMDQVVRVVSIANIILSYAVACLSCELARLSGMNTTYENAVLSAYKSFAITTALWACGMVLLDFGKLRDQITLAPAIGIATSVYTMEKLSKKQSTQKT